MVEYHIVPSGNMWRLQKKGGTVVSNHRKKRPAVKKGRKVRGENDALIIHRSDGTVQERVG
ncbi:MAG: DUF2188 domain-containing protein [Halobacteriales archaeon]